MKGKGTVLAAAFLLASNCIGVGYYAIPILTGSAGLWPGLLMGFVVWLYLLIMGLFYLEGILISPPGANVATLSRHFLGTFGFWFVSIPFLILSFYFLGSSISLSGEVLHHIMLHQLGLDIPSFFFILFFCLLFGVIVYLGMDISLRLNVILFSALILTFFLMLGLGAHKVSSENLITKQWYLVFFSVPLLISSYSYQTILPSLVSYFKKDVKKMVQTIGIGMLFPLIVYSLWQWLTIGSSDTGTLWKAYETKQPIYQGLMLLKESLTFETILWFMSLFAVITSILTNGIVLVDYFTDAFKCPEAHEKTKKRISIVCLVFLVGCLLSLIFPLFLEELINNFIGWSEVIFNGIFPLWLVVRARYVLQLPTTQLVPGGKWTISILVVATFFLIYLVGIGLIQTNW